MTGPSHWWLPLMVLSICLCAALGFWQLERAGEKEKFLALRGHNAAQAPAGTIAALSGSAAQLQPINLDGQYLHEYSLFLDNRTRGGRAGLEVVTPFREQSSGRVVLVNRGWMPFAGDRSRMPLPPAGEASGGIRAEIYHGPRPLLGSLEEALRAAMSDTPVVPYLQADIIGAHFGLRLEPVILRLRDSGAGALRLDWPPAGIGPDRHRGYAVQWFSLALAFFVMTLVAYRRHRPPRPKPDE